MTTNNTCATKNEVIALLLNSIVVDKPGHLLLDYFHQDVLRQLDKTGYLNLLHVDGRVVDVSYNAALIRFYNAGGFST